MDNIDSRIGELLDERNHLEDASINPSDNLDLIFGKYEATPVIFEVHVGENFRDDVNTNALIILNKIFGEYSKLEYLETELQNYCTRELSNRFKKYSDGFIWDASNWRLAISPIRAKDNYEKVLGFSAKFFHNFNGYPTKSIPLDCEVESQLRYRKALNEVETTLVKQDVKYDILTNIEY